MKTAPRLYSGKFTSHLDRFRKIRNDANYRGFKVSVSQAEEIIEFWDRCGKEITALLTKQTAGNAQKTNEPAR